MRKFLVPFFVLVAIMGLASLAFGADAGAVAGKVKLDGFGLGLTLMGATLGLGLGAAGCGLAQGLAVKSACEGIARNPDASGKIQVVMILGLAFIESLAIYALVINLLLIFVNPFV